MKLTDFKVLTFDCYGTLIDWETGLWQALEPLATAAGKSRDEALADYAQEESAQQQDTPGMLYRDLLTAVHRRLAAAWKVDASDEINARFGASVPNWPAFDDLPAALVTLQKRYKLVVLSNVDRQSFAGSNKRLGVTFDAIYTAEDIGSYKPDPRNFDYLLEHLKQDFGFEHGDILHTAQSLHHDHVPASRIGLARCWIDRQHLRDGGGAGVTKVPEEWPEPHFYFTTLSEMAEAVAREGATGN